MEEKSLLIRSLLTKIVQQRMEKEVILQNVLNNPQSIYSQHDEILNILKEISILDISEVNLMKYTGSDKKEE